MDAPDLVTVLIKAIYLSMLLSMPTIAVAAIVGTLFSLLQALTQIQEQTLSFAVKLIAVGATLFLTADWVGGELLNYTLTVFEAFPRGVR